MAGAVGPEASFYEFSNVSRSPHIANRRAWRFNAPENTMLDAYYTARNGESCTREILIQDFTTIA